MEGRQGGKGDKLKTRGSRGKDRSWGSSRAEGAVEPVLLLYKHLPYRMPLKTKPPINTIGWQESQGPQVMEAVGDRQEVRKESRGNPWTFSIPF